MKIRQIRIVVARLVISVLTLSAFPQFLNAQTIPTNPTVATPLRVEPDRNGLDLATGKFTISGPTISIPADSHLSFQRIQDLAPYLVGTVVPAGEDVNASFSVHTGGGSSESFSCPDYDCTNQTADGATLNGQTYQDGQNNAVYTFDVQQSAASGTNRTAMYYVSRVVFTDGEALTYTYATTYYTGAGGMQYPSQRPVQIKSNTGYYITISYQSDDIASQNYGVPAQVAAFGPADASNPIDRLTYGTDGSITDLGGRVYHCPGCAGAIGGKVEGTASSLTLPGDGSPSVSMGQGASSNISSFNRDGVNWSYTFSNLRANIETQDFNYSGIVATGPAGYLMNYTVSQTGQHNNYNIITSQQDALNRTTLFTYDNYMRVTKITYPEGGAVQIAYDGLGNIVQKTTKAKPSTGLADLIETNYFDPNCGQFTCNRPVWHRDALNRQTDYTYDAEGQLISQADPADTNGVRKMAYIQYDAHDTGSGIITRPIVVRVCGATTTCGTGSEIRTEYDYWGNTFLPSAKRQIDAVSGVTLTTTYTYDNAGRMLSMDGPLPGTDDAVYMRYDVYGRKTWEIGGRGSDGLHPAKLYTYRDADDKVIRVQTGTVSDPSNPSLTEIDQTDTNYDSRRYAVRDAVSSPGNLAYMVTDKAYDDRGQLTCTAERLNAGTFGSLPASACTPGTQGNDGPDRITVNSYDAAGQLLKITKAYGTSLQQDYATYTYSGDGKQLSLTDARGYLATMSYDGFDRQVQWTFPSPSATGQVNGADYEAYGYDAVGNRTSLRKRDGRTIAHAYDGLNRLSSKTYPNGGARGVFYTYDVQGEMTAARLDSASGADAVTRSYDGLGRMLSGAVAMGGTARTLTYQYDAASNRTRITHPDGVWFSFTYDALDRPQQTATSDGTLRNAKGYDAAGRLSSNFGGALTYGYDGMSRLQTLSTTDVSGGSAGNTTTLAYNTASQITSEARSNDAYAFTGAVNINRGYAANGLNQYTSAGAASFGYDANGNLTTDGTTTYVYDIENRLVSASSGASLIYDPLGRLYQTSGGSQGTTQYLYDGDALAAEYDGSGNLLRRYSSAVGEDTPELWLEGAGLADTRYLFADHEGSIVALFEPNLSRTAINAYDDYGIPNANNTGRFQYTGQIWLPELGMYYYKARVYSPTLGRFMQVDPIGYSNEDNLYNYVNNDPLNRNDPKGLYDCPNATQCDSIGRAIDLARNALKTPELGTRILSSEARLGLAGLDTLGSKNDHNGINIGNSTALGDKVLGETTGNNIQLNFKGIRDAGGIRVGAGVIVHESVHNLQNRLRGEMTNNGERYEREQEAFRAGSYANYRLGVSPRNQPVYGSGTFQRDLNRAAKEDCQFANSTYHFSDGCQ